MSTFIAKKRFRLSRRTALRGLGLGGISVALPPLEAMMNDRGHFLRKANAATPPPLVFVTFFVPNGVYPENFWPTDTGQAWKASRCLAPLEPHRADFNILQNLRKDEAYRGQNISTDAHARGHASFATGGSLKSGSQLEFASVDQVAAQALGGSTKFRSLPVALGGLRPPAGDTLAHISWKADGTPLPADRDPVALFNRLFADFASAEPSAAPKPLTNYKQSVLDHIKGDIASLQSRLGNADRQTLARHLEGIREVEKQIKPGAGDMPLASGCEKPETPAAKFAGEPPGIDDGKGGYANERAQVLIKLQVMALACDLTRFGSFMLATRRNKRQFGWLGAVDGADGHHGISHDSSPAGYEKQTKIVLDEMEQFAFMLAQMKAVKQGDSTLLRNAVVFWASEHGHGEGHDFKNVPVIVAGQAGGRFATGKHIRYPVNTPYSNVFVSILNALGVPTQSFGPFGKAPLDSLTA